MRTANTSCARSTGIKGQGRRGARWLLPGAVSLALALPAFALAQAAEPDARVNADPTFPFSREIEAFAKAEEKGPKVANATLFLGSSSIRLWDIHGSFPDVGTVNRGFGGATTRDVLHYYPRLLPRSKPRSVIVYVGENDLAAGASPQDVARDVLTLLKKLRTDYPKAHIAYLSLKPSPIRWTLWPKMAAVNMTVAARSRVMGFDYIDVSKTLLASDGLPDASLFRQDGLHMNGRGYDRWTDMVDAYLDRAQMADSRQGTSAS
ncbi:GDSL-type esterase/lipase family protein [Sphingobium cloacae]|uniref:GDSL-type esterase/lipase family protein n=1 Tax=Sphingobium cloacae TaxID=120107 RepID=UPI0008346AE7|nr:GDSL-type esterase/lipase family protein [Sphingobium cloacae]